MKPGQVHPAFVHTEFLVTDCRRCFLHVVMLRENFGFPTKAAQMEALALHQEGGHK